MKNYRSSIPKAARERVVSTHESNGEKQKAEYLLNGKVVGVRQFDVDGEIATETPFKNGVIHGIVYCFESGPDGRARVNFAEPYRNGLAYGTARQWSLDGEKLIGTYTMKHGTGLDLWRNWDYERKHYYLSEARYLEDGKWHGFEWWLDEDQTTVFEEHHFWKNLQHGIQREWNNEGRLRRGFPRYWLNNERVTKRKYLRAQASDRSLPPFRAADNLPRRNFPPEVMAAIKSSAEIPVPPAVD